jgi:hypothetical protein
MNYELTNLYINAVLNFVKRYLTQQSAQSINQCSVNQPINNNHRHLFLSYMFRPLQGHNQEGICKGIQVQQILSKMCVCAVLCMPLYIPS